MESPPGFAPRPAGAAPAQFLSGETSSNPTSLRPAGQLPLRPRMTGISFDLGAGSAAPEVSTGSTARPSSGKRGGATVAGCGPADREAVGKIRRRHRKSSFHQRRYRGRRRHGWRRWPRWRDGERYSGKVRRRHGKRSLRQRRLIGDGRHRWHRWSRRRDRGRHRGKVRHLHRQGSPSERLCIPVRRWRDGWRDDGLGRLHWTRAARKRPAAEVATPLSSGLESAWPASGPMAEA